MTYFLEITQGKITKTIMATVAALACFFGNHAEAQADLSVAIDGRLNTVLMPGLGYSPTTIYGLTLQILGCFSTGKRWTILD